MTTISRLLIIGTVWPEPSSSAAGCRMMQLISMLCHDYEITCCSIAAESEFMPDLKIFGVTTKSISLNSSDFDDFVAELKPEIVLFDRFLTEEQFGWRIANTCPDALRILDMEDLHCLRRTREKALKANLNFVESDLFTDDDAKRELASIWRSDLTLVISEFEMRLLTETFKVDGNLLHYIPLLVENMPSADELLPIQERKDFIFIGNFFHKPNVDAVKCLKAEIWPKIRQSLPDVSLHIYGAYPSEEILQMNSPKTGFLVHGRAESAMEVVKKARVVLAPLRFGAGIKGKLLEAMQCGTPSVTTSIGAEAMNGTLPWNGTIADDMDVFAEASVRLYQDEKRWSDSQRNGFEILKDRFQRKDCEPDFLSRISDLKANLKIHRQKNFIGSMLQFHTLRSTEFLSRWIEEKNKNRLL